MHNTVRHLLSWLHSPGFPFVTSGCEAAMQNAAEKLSDYVKGTKQPAISLFKAVHVFDLRQLPVLSKTLADFIETSNIEQALNEWQIYLDNATNEELPDDVAALWRAMQHQLPMLSALAISYVTLPVASIDVEHSFLKYDSVLSLLRQSLSQDCL